MVFYVSFLIQSKLSNVRVTDTDLFPRSQKFLYFRQIVNDINTELDNICSLYQALFSKSNDDWLQANGKPNPQLFWNDHLHLSKTGYQKFCNFTILFDLSKIENSFPPLSKTNIHISTKQKNVHHFEKQKFCKPKYIHKSFALCLHIRDVSVPVTAICVLSSPFFISANISKTILVSASTVSAVSDATMQSVNVTSVPICRSLCRNQCRIVFFQPSTLLLRAVNISKLRVHCHDICNIAPSTCISVNCIEILLNVITSNIRI